MLFSAYHVVSCEQSKRIEIAFNKLQDNENNLTRNELMNVLGQYPPENVIKVCRLCP